MEAVRKHFQGITNIVRFNWHFYVLSFGLIICVLWLNSYFKNAYQPFAYIICFLTIFTTIISLIVSYIVYDVSQLYTLKWLDNIPIFKTDILVNINAGFDETSVLIKAKYPDNTLIVYDFYDPQKHTEISIERARKAYPPYPNTQSIATSKIPLADNCIDVIFLTLAAHEIRETQERIVFFRELNRILKTNGHIIVTEHLRDLPNFLAYNIGFFHFFSKKSWYNTFNKAHCRVIHTIKITPFISTFILKKNGNTP
jgi:hypothetical protein